MRKLLNLREVDNVHMIFGDEIFDTGVTIYQLSDFPERTRKIIGQLIVELIWKKIYHQKQRVQIVLDEFQNLKLVNTAVEAMLREGRRYGIGVIMISQYAPLGKEKDVLEQAITSFYFRPNSRNLESIAKMIDYENYKEWKIILRKLNRGECIFVGDYKINNKTPSNLEPLLCEVKR